MCEQCNLLNSAHVVGGDELIAIIVPDSSAALAYLVPRQHAPLSELPAAVQERLFTTANMLSSVIFDNMQVQGTNIIVADEQHAQYSVVGRTEADGLELRWNPTRSTPAELSDTAKRISEATWYIGKEKPSKPHHGVTIELEPSPMRPPAEIAAPAAVAADLNTVQSESPKKRKKENYQLKQLHRRR
jgi:hypothetical protein